MTDGYEDLLYRAKRSQLAPEEVEAVAQELLKEHSDGDSYTLLHILGKAGGVAYRPLVESFLEYREYTMLPRLALQILCEMWGEPQRYLEHIATFVRGVPWDTGDWVRLAAISIAGEYLRDHADDRLLAELVRLCTADGEREIVRRTAYEALARAVGRGWEATSRRAPIDDSVIEEAELRLTSRGR